MKKFIAAVFAIAGVLISLAPAARAEESAAPPAPAAVAASSTAPVPDADTSSVDLRIGAGANYWVSIESIHETDFDTSGLSGFVTFQYVPNSIVKLEVDIELLPKGFLGSSQTVFQPQMYVLLGNFIYGGVGVGMYYTDGSFSSDPFFALKGGIDIPFGPVHLDISGNYRFEGTLKTRDVSSDTVFLGAAVRYAF